MAQIPKYEAVKQYITTLISDQMMSPGDRIPSETELIKALNVSGITIRKALSDLTAEGIVRRVRGKGSFVADGKSAGSVRTVAMLFALSDIEESAFGRLIQGAQQYLSNNNCSLFVECLGEDPTTAKKQLARLIEHSVDGFLLYLSNPDNMLELIDMACASKPVVMLDRKTKARDMSYAGCNNVGGAVQATNCLLDNGHERIGFAFHNDHLSSEQERYLGYCQALEARGIHARDQHKLYIKSTSSADIKKAVCSGQASAYFTANDECAIMMYDHMVESGLSVPGDVSLIGFDNSAKLRCNNYPLTTIEQPFEMLGRAAADLMLAITQGRALERTQILVGTRLIERDSVKALSQIKAEQPDIYDVMRQAG